MHIVVNELDANGMQLFAVHMPHATDVTVALCITAGSTDETEDTAGLFHFIEHMFYKGTEETAETTVFAKGGLIGARVNAWTTDDHTCYHATTNVHNWPLAWELQHNMLLNGMPKGETIRVDTRNIVSREREKRMEGSEITMDSYSADGVPPIEVTDTDAAMKNKTPDFTANSAGMEDAGHQPHPIRESFHKRFATELGAVLSEMQKTMDNPMAATLLAIRRRVLNDKRGPGIPTIGNTGALRTCSYEKLQALRNKHYQYGRTVTIVAGNLSARKAQTPAGFKKIYDTVMSRVTDPKRPTMLPNVLGSNYNTTQISVAPNQRGETTGDNLEPITAVDWDGNGKIEAAIPSANFKVATTYLTPGKDFFKRYPEMPLRTDELTGIMSYVYNGFKGKILHDYFIETNDAISAMYIPEIQQNVTLHTFIFTLSSENLREDGVKVPADLIFKKLDGMFFGLFNPKTMDPKVRALVNDAFLHVSLSDQDAIRRDSISMVEYIAAGTQRLQATPGMITKGPMTIIGLDKVSHFRDEKNRINYVDPLWSMRLSRAQREQHMPWVYDVLNIFTTSNEKTYVQYRFVLNKAIEGETLESVKAMAEAYDPFRVYGTQRAMPESDSYLAERVQQMDFPRAMILNMEIQPDYTKNKFRLFSHPHSDQFVVLFGWTHYTSLRNSIWSCMIPFYEQLILEQRIMTKGEEDEEITKEQELMTLKEWLQNNSFRLSIDIEGISILFTPSGHDKNTSGDNLNVNEGWIGETLRKGINYVMSAIHFHYTKDLQEIYMQTQKMFLADLAEAKFDVNTVRAQVIRGQLLAMSEAEKKVNSTDYYAWTVEDAIKLVSEVGTDKSKLLTQFVKIFASRENMSIIIVIPMQSSDVGILQSVVGDVGMNYFHLKDPKREVSKKEVKKGTEDLKGGEKVGADDPSGRAIGFFDTAFVAKKYDSKNMDAFRKTNGKINIGMPGVKNQALITMVRPAAVMLSQDKIYEYAESQIVGAMMGGSPFSRMMQVLRVWLGLVYWLSYSPGQSYFTDNKGIDMITTSTKVQNMDEVVEYLKHFMDGVNMSGKRLPNVERENDVSHDALVRWLKRPFSNQDVKAATMGILDGMYNTMMSPVGYAHMGLRITANNWNISIYYELFQAYQALMLKNSELTNYFRGKDAKGKKIGENWALFIISPEGEDNPEIRAEQADEEQKEHNDMVNAETGPQTAEATPAAADAPPPVAAVAASRIRF